MIHLMQATGARRDFQRHVPTGQRRVAQQYCAKRCYSADGNNLRPYGYRAGYSGKWRLDGNNYFGDGEPGGGFEPDWWYDGKRYAEDIGEEMFEAYLNSKTSQQLREAGFIEENIWGHRVADKAIAFLDQVGADPFGAASIAIPQPAFRLNPTPSTALFEWDITRDD